jgi:DNA-directed RNA polymerase specialized sigma24 family protein
MSKNKQKNPKGKHYVTNKEMITELKKLKKTGVIGERLHLIFYEMAEQIGTKGRFSGYTWIEDMVSDAYLKCCIIAHKFDTERTNPFGYFTTVIIHYFWDALAGEKKQKNIKDKLRDEQISQLYHRYGIQFKVGQRHDM